MDIISVNTFWTIWLLVHLVLAVALIGALTHQAIAVAMPVRQVAGPGGFVTRFRAVPAAGYATAVCVMWVLTFVVDRTSTRNIESTSAFRSSRPAIGRRKASLISRSMSRPSV